MTFEDDELSEAAKTLHREWESPNLWPAIAAGIKAEEERARTTSAARTWYAWAAAAVLILATAASLVVVRNWPAREGASPVAQSSDPLLSDEALTDLEQAEARYIAAIDALAARAAPAISAPETPLAAQLRERLLVIDAAIADCRAEIERNRFNAHLRRQLLAIYQEKRLTLEQILELEQHVS